jgi:hypothetical protein
VGQERGDKTGQGKSENIVGGTDQQVVVQVAGLDSKLEVAQGAEAFLVGIGPIIEDSDGLVAGPISGPLAE